MINNFPDNYRLVVSPDDYEKKLDLEDRRLYLAQEIRAFDADEMTGDMSLCSYLADVILAYNREDKGIAPEDRKPIRLYINSPGGDVTEGFSLISAIKLSKTPIYTINVGVWYSMAFLIGITGHKRFSLPCSTFLMHEGHNLVWDSGSKAQDKMDFDKRFELEVVKKHILEHSNMKSTEYDSLFRVEYYMLPEDALERNFIDEIVTDIDTIL
ncbi:ATP-dependent Clp protease proteolytic subunit [Candidatus Saccharibacteria bacterium]|nr:ATP-dependent Clp protease proteolytic subunit [Candidatus Saccharibacteria bacterium]